jgi:hypothetical protein
MARHTEMCARALTDPFKERSSSNFYYKPVTYGFGGSSNEKFRHVGTFISYTTPVAHLVQNQITSDMELHITTHRYSPTTDRQLRHLHGAVLTATVPPRVYYVPELCGAPYHRMDSILADRTRTTQRHNLDDLAFSKCQHKTVIQEVTRTIEVLKYAMHLMLDGVPPEIYSQFYTPQQTKTLQKLTELRLQLGYLLDNCNGDGKTLKLALQGILTLDKD